MVIVNRFIVKFFSGGFAAAIAFWPFVFVYHAHCRQDMCLLNHERIHLRQQIEMLIIPFYIWYFLEFFIRFAYHRNHYLAYRSISFEQEAYNNEENPHYLAGRPPWSFLKKSYFYLHKR